MGYRTVVVLNNDRTSEWENDPMLGQKIAQASSMSFYDRNRGQFQTGKVVQVAHADEQSLMIMEHYDGDVVAARHWSRSDTEGFRDLRLLDAFANKLGYKLVKK